MNTKAVNGSQTSTITHEPAHALNTQETKKPQIAAGPERQGELFNRRVDNPVQGTREAITRRRHWESLHVPSMDIKGSGGKKLSEFEVSAGLSKYSKDQLSWPAAHHSYVEKEDGARMLMKHGNYQGGVSMVMYAANPDSTPQYTTQEILQTAGEPLHHVEAFATADRKSTRLNSSHIQKSRMPSSA